MRLLRQAFAVVLTALIAALEKVGANGATSALVASADKRSTRAGSVQEFQFGHGAAAFVVGRENIGATFLGSNSTSVDFVDHFRGEGEEGLLRRDDYINNRVQSQGAIGFVQYENMVLQFIGDTAVITYRNVLKNKDANGQPDDTEYISWADIYVKEEGEWKIGAVHVIDYRTENP